MVVIVILIVWDTADQRAIQHVISKVFSLG